MYADDPLETLQLQMDNARNKAGGPVAHDLDRDKYENIFARFANGLFPVATSE